MEKKGIINILILSVFIYTFISCGSSKKIAMEKQSASLGEEVMIPCSDEEYHTDKEYFRATGIGLSTDLSTSKQKANLNASANLAASINKLIKRVADQYVNEREVADKGEFSRKFEEITREVVKQEIINLAIVCSKTFNKEGKYTTYMAVEVNRSEVVDKVENKLSKDEKINQDFEKMKFEKILDKEMDEFSKQ